MIILTDGKEEASEAGEIDANKASGIKDGRVIRQGKSITGV